eukprot:m.24715 g.24715  ORF g.24715 m.24715 type:complete len:302 (-) comp8628_c0_seq2:127-1032(-)
MAATTSDPLETSDTLEFFIGTRGVRLHCREQLPEGGAKNAKAIVVLVHGYAHHIDSYMGGLNPDLYTSNGIIICGISHHGCGHSEGLRCLVEDFDHLVTDISDYTLSQASKYPGLPIFMIGQSMGGAITLLSTAVDGPLKDVVKGVVLLAPMCKIAKEMMFPNWVINTFYWLAYLLPWLPATPTPNTLDLCFKDKQKLEEARTDELGYHQKPRLMTGYQMIQGTAKVQERLSTYKTPFFVQHGGEDYLTALETSELLYESAQSVDKTIKVYDGFWHALLSEPNGGGEVVVKATFDWIAARI